MTAIWSSEATWKANGGAFLGTGKDIAGKGLLASHRATGFSKDIYKLQDVNGVVLRAE